MKKSLQRTLGIILALGMAVPLSACGKKKADKNSGGNESTEDIAAGDARPVTKSGHVVSESDTYYNVLRSEIKPHVPEGKELFYSAISEHVVVGDRVLVGLMLNYVMPEDVEKKLNDLDLRDEGAWDEYEKIMNQYTENIMQMFDLQGNYIGNVETPENSEFIGAYPGKDGEILVVASVFEMKQCASTPKVFVISNNGEKIRDVNLQISEPLSDMQIYSVGNGNLLLASTGKFYMLDADGKVLSEESNPNLCGTMLCSGGRWYAVMPDYSGDELIANIQEIDIDTGKLIGSPVRTIDSFYMLTQGEKDCFISNSNGIVKYDLIEQKSLEILNWNDTDVNSKNLSLIGGRIRSEDEMVFFEEKAAEDDGRSDMDRKAGSGTIVNIVTLSKADKNPHAGKTVLKLGLNGYSDSSFIEEVLNYNLDPDNKARIEIYDYMADAYMTGSLEAYEKSLGQSVDKLTMDMLSGNGPDILVGYSSVSQFNNENMLIDLNPLLDSDTSINRDDYFDNLFRAFEENGKLYSIPLTCYIEGLALDTGFPGAKENMTFTEFDQLASSLSENVQILSSQSYEELLKSWLPHLCSHFIDNENKTVSFDSEEFKAFLELIKKYGQTKVADNGPYAPTDGFNLNDDVLFGNGMIATCYANIGSLDSYSNYKHLARKGGLVFSGIPSSEGMGLSVKGELSMSITSAAQDPELAWNFISNFLKEDVQKELSFYTATMPVNRNAFAANCKTEIEVNRTFVKELKEDAAKYPDKVGDIDNYLEFNEADQAELAKLIEGVSQAEKSDTDVVNIILEEAPGFFSGQRTVEDVCKNIQNRATTVVQER